MRTASFGRFFFGAATVPLGIIALIWHDADTWQALYWLVRSPVGTAVGDSLMTAQIVGGLALMFPRSVRVGSTILAVVFALTSLACVHGIVAAPKVYAQYGSFFEQFAMLCGALAAYATTVSSADASASWRRV